MSSTHREGVNPLRPYYIPPTIGEAADPVAAANANPFSGRNATSSTRYASKARDVLADLDYKDYLGDSSPSVVQNVKELVDELLWKYTSVLMAQPFEVAKTILQARDQDESAALAATPEPGSLKRQTSGQGASIYDYQDSDSEGDEPAYFTSNVPGTPTPSYPRSSSNHGASSSSPALKKPAVPEHYLTLRRPDSVAEVIGQLWQRDGAWGVWKGSNATFLYTVLQSLLENWSRSFLSAIFNVPDLGVKEDIDRLIDIASPYPWVSLFVAGAAAVATGVLLSPLDLVRTKLILTPNKGQRRTLATLRSLPSYLCPSAIALPTVLNSLVHPLLTLSTPLVLRTRFMIDSQVSPMTFSVAKFLASSAAILVKLPVETVLRRGQMAVLSGQHYIRALGAKEQRMDTIVPIGRYKGVFGTMYHIASEEGAREIPPAPASKKGKGKARAFQPTHRKGQGLEGLWRGWKVNWWGLVGLWTASVVGHGGEGEF
ncbi:mitochondrial fusion and transport protein Ugo1 [Purpureocillium lavendulum]|uniref:Mitochondrial fusion and transport protein Ugo1 n=1 Tax=Purpureocillium lavendulum TaxID=1247861 RepID=A0AB34FHB3_9HYPO|nr:mitochondrial fusion and transport protein Ugo1 [Purpureocillium lavendulum]